MRTLQDLFEHEIKDLYSAEKQLMEVLPKIVKEANDADLKRAFQNNLEETKSHFNQIQEICENLKINPTSTICKAMEGLVKDCENMIKHDANPDVKDAGLIACVQKVEHYEIAGYGTATKFAKQLGHQEIAIRLQTILNQEYNADNNLDMLAERRINAEAMG